VPPDIYRTVQEFLLRGSTKEKAVVEIIKHHLLRENWQSNPLIWSNGIPDVEPRNPAEPIATPTTPTKFVVYTEFVGMMKYLKSVSLEMLVLCGE
jgi:hypothetical protein